MQDMAQQVTKLKAVDNKEKKEKVEKPGTSVNIWNRKPSMMEGSGNSNSNNYGANNKMR